MPTNNKTIEALERIACNLTNLGVISADLKMLKMHIKAQKRQIAWKKIDGKWVYMVKKKSQKVKQ